MAATTATSVPALTFCELAERLAGFDVHVADADGLAAGVALAGRARAWLDAFDVAVARRVRVLTVQAPEASVTVTPAKPPELVSLSHPARRSKARLNVATPLNRCRINGLLLDSRVAGPRH